MPCFHYGSFKESKKKKKKKKKRKDKKRKKKRKRKERIGGSKKFSRSDSKGKV